MRARCLSFSLSLSLTHTDTHSHTQTHTHRAFDSPLTQRWVSLITAQTPCLYNNTHSLIQPPASYSASLHPLVEITSPYETTRPYDITLQPTVTTPGARQSNYRLFSLFSLSLSLFSLSLSPFRHFNNIANSVSIQLQLDFRRQTFKPEGLVPHQRATIIIQR